MPVTNPTRPGAIYQSPPNSGGNDGALPTAYDANWQLFQNLTPDQILAFQAMPQELTKYAHIRRWQKEMDLINAIRSPFDNGSGPVVQPPIDTLIPQLLQAIKTTQAQLAQALTGINATPPTITTRAQIDAVIL